MTNYNNEKDRRLRGSMAPKTEDDVALAGTNSSETENKPEALAGSNSGEEKEIARSGSNAVEEEEPHTSLKDEAKKIMKEIEDKLDPKK
ncbi:rRNA processing protein [Enterococcus raffinosus]|uniref:rRNA processing protein n=1 Tax=Enterococcus raffinosus TaxID=71452 RepID=UPI001C10DA02|nr:rRNA processing protein [Enterococcus raffinosus]MBU5361040.1 rRNA processing protein [Enterococcus raffinosus]